MKAITIIILAVISASCMTVRRIEKNCDKFAKVCVAETVVKIEYRDTTIYKDRIIEVELPKDTVFLTDTVSIINNRCYLPMRHKKFGLVWVSAGVFNSVLTVTAGLTDSTILIPVRDTIFIDNAISNTTTENTVVLPPVKFIPKFYKFTFWIVMIAFAAAIGYVVYKIKGGWIRGIFSK